MVGNCCVCGFESFGGVIGVVSDGFMGDLMNLRVMTYILI